MSLPVPRLDDRRFQDIVDEAKRLIPRYCPEWTDHNVSDPGIALIELFAWMSEMILYRANQIPDMHYTKFLELMGITLFPAASARADVSFWLSTPQPEAVTIHTNTRVGTVRTEQDESVVFTSDDDLVIVVPELSRCLTATGAGQYEDHWDDLRIPGEKVTCFRGPAADDAVYFGFTESLAGNIVRLEFRASIDGVGVDPKRPPWAWEVWTGDAWTAARIHRDETGGLNLPGAVVLFVPSKHEPLTVGPARAFWVRCRVIEPTAGQPAYRSSPKVESLTVASLGGTASAHHSEVVGREILGRSDGTPGQTFGVRRSPVLPRKLEETVMVSGPTGEEPWVEVEHFADSGAHDRHFTWEAMTGQVAFGPRIVYPDGTVVQHGAIPAIDAEIAVTGYRYGGGRRGNVGAGTLTVLKSSIPFVARVENLETARGGVDAETVDNAKRRGPMSLRTGQRAVTVEDFERLTLEASPLVARARCVPPAQPGGAVRVLIVPKVEIAAEHLTLDDLALPEELVAAVSEHLEARRTLTTPVEIGTPFYQGITVVARIRGGAATDAELLRDRVLTALYAYVNPLTGGPEATGWPFGRELNLGEIFALVSGVDGVNTVEEVRIFLADLRTGERREGRQRAGLSQDAVFASFQHQVLVR